MHMWKMYKIGRRSVNIVLRLEEMCQDSVEMWRW